MKKGKRSKLPKLPMFSVILKKKMQAVYSLDSILFQPFTQTLWINIVKSRLKNSLDTHINIQHVDYITYTHICNGIIYIIEGNFNKMYSLGCR